MMHACPLSFAGAQVAVRRGEPRGPQAGPLLDLPPRLGHRSAQPFPTSLTPTHTLALSLSSPQHSLTFSRSGLPNNSPVAAASFAPPIFIVCFSLPCPLAPAPLEAPPPANSPFLVPLPRASQVRRLPRLPPGPALARRLARAAKASAPAQAAVQLREQLLVGFAAKYRAAATLFDDEVRGSGGGVRGPTGCRERERVTERRRTLSALHYPLPWNATRAFN